jgi:hypothetical protein
MNELKDYITRKAIQIPDWINTKDKTSHSVFVIMSEVIGSSTYLVSEKIYSDKKLINFNNKIGQDIDFIITLCENNRELMFLCFDRIINSYKDFKEVAIDLELYETAENFHKLELINMAIDRGEI